MSSKINVLLALSNPEHKEIIIAILKKEGCFNIVATDNGNHALVILKENRIDAVISSVYLKGISGLELLTLTLEIHNNPPFIFYNEFEAENFNILALKLGASYCISDRENLNYVGKIINNYVRNSVLDSSKQGTLNKKFINSYKQEGNLKEVFMENNSIEEKNLISNILLESGFVTKWNGYRYLVRIIEILSENERYLSSITKKIYPMIAQEFFVSVNSVEKSIRDSIKKAFDDGNNDKFLQNFCYINKFNDKKPTNGEFIGILYNIKKTSEGE